ncbi:MAG: DUF2878 domain-containing protein [Gammaproteobacteria bacterium]|nr:DUF2878 domain-containing protein [Gammaproteobacteria bacterium]NNF61305.1 DUF2878 domain-containing protein [Gammaproteobacteria bacterium]NNM20863.1 DUF2878 domain-containing protein [Gammaproteobacteria bacterium]
MNKFVINFVTFQVGWFSCVLGAANGYPLVGPVVVAAVLLLHFNIVDHPRRELVLIALAGMMGAVFDTLLVRSDWLIYPNGMLIEATAPYWIVSMWLLFASTINLSMRWMHDRFAAAVLLGAIGGPLSYLAGERLGGLVFEDRIMALIALAIGWGVVTPLLVALGQRFDGVDVQGKEVVAQHA